METQDYKIGTYVKALVDYPSGGSVKKGEVGIIKNFSENQYCIDFPSQMGYIVNKENLAKSNLYEIMSEKPNPEYVKFTNSNNWFKEQELEIGKIYKWADLINGNNESKLYLNPDFFDNWSDQFEESTREAYVLQNQPKFEVGKWYSFNWDWHSKTNGKTIIKVERLNEDRVITKNRIYLYSDEKNTNFTYEDGYNFYEISDIKKISIDEIQEFLPDGHVDKISKWVPEFKVGDKFENSFGAATITEVGNNPKEAYRFNDNTAFDTETYVNSLTQIDESMNKFKKGDYIVTLEGNFATDCGKKNYCFKQRIDCEYINPVYDLRGDKSNGNHTMAFDKKSLLLDWRYATSEEIAEYDRLGKPYDVTTLNSKSTEFVLPEKWCVKTTSGTRKIIGDFINERGYNTILTRDWLIHYPFLPSGGSAYPIVQTGYKEITFEQFKKYVLKEESEEWIPKVGDWIVVQESNYTSMYNNGVDFVAQIDQLNGKNYYWVKNQNIIGNYNNQNYKHLCCDNISFRKAEPHEIPTKEPGIVFIKEKESIMKNYTAEEALAELKRRGFKKGCEWVYMSADGSYDEVDIRTANREPMIKDEGRYIDCGGSFLWSIENPSHLHRGPHKTSSVPTTMKEIQEECKRRFPIGCTYKSVSTSYSYVLEKDNYTYSINGNNIYAHSGCGCLYSDGKYAEIVSLPGSHFVSEKPYPVVETDHDLYDWGESISTPKKTKDFLNPASLLPKIKKLPINKQSIN